MPNERTVYASEQELEELREEVRRLRGRIPAEQEQSREEEPKLEKPDKRDKKPHPLRRAVLIVVGVAIAVGVLLWWLHARQFESTDDAQVDSHINEITSRIAGAITAVYVEENQFVQAGQVIAELDPRDYQVAVEQAQGRLAQSEAQIRAEQPNIPVTEETTSTAIATAAQEVASAESAVAAAEQSYQAALARVREAEANNTKAQADVARYRPLAEKDEVPREQFDQVVATAAALAQTVAANQASAQAALKQVDQARAQLAQAQQRAAQASITAPHQIDIRRANVAARQAEILTSRAQLDQARLNVSYTKIVSPVKGIVAKRTAEVGQHVAAGQQILLVTQIDDMWVTANFKETQLHHMQPGQGVTIHVDALKTDFDGYVESMPASSGAITSLLPPENATGNFVKVVQRMPVRIRFKPGQNGLDRLRPGMSVEPKVRIG